MTSPRKKPRSRKAARPRPPKLASKAASKTVSTASVASKTGGNWSAEVARTSDALDLEPDVFEQDKPEDIAASLKRSAERSDRRKGTPFQSAMSMLNFYINRAGKALAPARKQVLERVKTALRKAFGKE